MKNLVTSLMAAVLAFSCYAQGTIIFHNRDLSPRNTAGGTYNFPISVDGENVRAQLYLVTPAGATATYTPLTPVQTTFDDPPFQYFFKEPVTVTVNGHLPGTTGLMFVVRVWENAASYEEALVTPGASFGESNLITVGAPLGGTSQNGVVFQPPDLGGPKGLESFCYGCFPESTHLSFVSEQADFPIRMGVEGDSFRVNTHTQSPFPWVPSYSIETSADFETWTPLLANKMAGRASFTVPYSRENPRAFFRLRAPPVGIPPLEDGTISFNNRNLSERFPGGGFYHAPISGFPNPAAARAQLYLVTNGGALTPLFPVQTFRTVAGQTEFFTSVLTVKVPGQAPGTTGLQFLVRAWEGTESYDTASRRITSNLIRVHAPLGGMSPSGITYLSPDLGGPDGLEAMAYIGF